MPVFLRRRPRSARMSPSGPILRNFPAQILKSRHEGRTVSPFALGSGVANLELLNRQNDAVNLNSLCGLLAGCYDLAVCIEPADFWLYGVSVVGEPSGDALQCVGVLALPEAFVDFHGRLFVVQLFHPHYASRAQPALGYMITPDPMLSVLVRNRTPFSS